MRRSPTALLTIALLCVAAALGGCTVDLAAVARTVEAAAFDMQQSGTDASLRGVCAVSTDVCWASGSGGTVLRTTDGGATWRAGVIPGASELDFRGIHAVDADTAWVASAGLPARVYRTDDGGRTWLLQHERLDDGVFFDALEAYDAQRLLLFSDPVGGRVLVLRTLDGGATWTEADRMPPARPGEAGFAASDTCLAVYGTSDAWIGTGGGPADAERPGRARVYRSRDGGATWSVVETPMAAGPSSGIFSLAFRDDGHGIAVGGDYLAQDDTDSNAMVTRDGGARWVLASIAPPRGYRSVVRWVPGLPAPVAIAAGEGGVDYSVNDGWSWAPLSDEGFHALDFVRGGEARPDGGAVGWAVGGDGRVARVRIAAP